MLCLQKIYQSKRSERYMRIMNDTFCKYLPGTGDNWSLFAYPCCYAMKTSVSCKAASSSYEIVFYTTHQICIILFSLGETS